MFSPVDKDYFSDWENFVQYLVFLSFLQRIFFSDHFSDLENFYNKCLPF